MKISTDRGFAEVRAPECALLPCLHVGEDKGSFSHGRGYTSYHADGPRLVCMTRHCHGCPTPIPPVEAERARCCPAPDLAQPRGGRTPYRQRCRTCGTWHGRTVLPLVRELPKHPHARCRHLPAAPFEWVCEPAWKCSGCGLYWDAQPKPFQPGEDLAKFAARRREKTGGPS